MTFEHTSNVPEREVEPEELRPLLDRTDVLMAGIIGDAPQTSEAIGATLSKGAQFPLINGGSVLIAQSQTEKYTSTNLKLETNSYNEGGYIVQKIKELHLIQEGKHISPQYLVRSQLVHDDKKVVLSALDALRGETMRHRNPWAIAALAVFDALPNSDTAQPITEQVVESFLFEMSMADPHNRRVHVGREEDFTIPDLS